MHILDNYYVSMLTRATEDLQSSGILRNVKKFLHFLTLEDGAYRLSRIVGKGLPLDAA
jgi:hypothetical protein